MKRFIFDSILDEENICNLEKEKHKITKGVDHGLKLLVYRLTDTGSHLRVQATPVEPHFRKPQGPFF